MDKLFQLPAGSATSDACSSGLDRGANSHFRARRRNRRDPTPTSPLTAVSSRPVRDWSCRCCVWLGLLGSNPTPWRAGFVRSYRGPLPPLLSPSNKGPGKRQSPHHVRTRPDTCDCAAGTAPSSIVPYSWSPSFPVLEDHPASLAIIHDKSNNCHSNE